VRSWWRARVRSAWWCGASTGGVWGCGRSVFWVPFSRPFRTFRFWPQPPTRVYWLASRCSPHTARAPPTPYGGPRTYRQRPCNGGSVYRRAGVWSDFASVVTPPPRRCGSSDSARLYRPPPALGRPPFSFQSRGRPPLAGRRWGFGALSFGVVASGIVLPSVAPHVGGVSPPHASLLPPHRTAICGSSFVRFAGVWRLSSGTSLRLPDGGLLTPTPSPALSPRAGWLACGLRYELRSPVPVAQLSG